MSKRFNPPPNWPQPPRDWNPAPGWKPDPRWGPAPAGWQLWVDEDEAPVPTSADTRPPQRIFISYRRSDCQPQANGLHDGLRHRLPEARLFMDVEAIPAGVDFEEHIRAEIEVCDLILVLIGDNWLDPIPGRDARRIDDPEDFVRLEIEAALTSPRCRVLPVLVEGATMPRANELPDSISKLARINAIELSDQRWSADLQRLTQLIETIREEELEKATRHVERPEGGVSHTPAEAPLRLTDIDRAAVAAAIASQPSTFRTKDISGSREVRNAHPAISGRSNFDAMIGRFLKANNGQLGLGEPGPATDDRGAVWTKAVAAPTYDSPPRHVNLPGGPPSPPPWTPPPPKTGAGTGPWLLAFVPLVTCGIGAFAPVLWAMSRRRGDPQFRKKALLFGALVTVAGLVGFVLVGAAPTDSEGNATGAMSGVGGGILLIAALIGTCAGVYLVWADSKRRTAPPA